MRPSGRINEQRPCALMCRGSGSGSKAGTNLRTFCSIIHVYSTAVSWSLSITKSRLGLDGFFQTRFNSIAQTRNFESSNLAHFKTFLVKLSDIWHTLDWQTLDVDIIHRLKWFYTGYKGEFLTWKSCRARTDMHPIHYSNTSCLCATRNYSNFHSYEFLKLNCFVQDHTNQSWNF